MFQKFNKFKTNIEKRRRDQALSYKVKTYLNFFSRIAILILFCIVNLFISIPFLKITEQQILSSLTKMFRSIISFILIFFKKTKLNKLVSTYSDQFGINTLTFAKAGFVSFLNNLFPFLFGFLTIYGNGISFFFNIMDLETFVGLTKYSVKLIHFFFGRDFLIKMEYIENQAIQLRNSFFFLCLIEFGFVLLFLEKNIISFYFLGKIIRKDNFFYNIFVFYTFLMIFISKTCSVLLDKFLSFNGIRNEYKFLTKSAIRLRCYFSFLNLLAASNTVVYNKDISSIIKTDKETLSLFKAIDIDEKRDGISLVELNSFMLEKSFLFFAGDTEGLKSTLNTFCYLKEKKVDPVLLSLYVFCFNFEIKSEVMNRKLLSFLFHKSEITSGMKESSSLDSKYSICILDTKSFFYKHIRDYCVNSINSTSKQSEPTTSSFSSAIDNENYFRTLKYIDEINSIPKISFLIKNFRIEELFQCKRKIIAWIHQYFLNNFLNFLSTDTQQREKFLTNYSEYDLYSFKNKLSSFKSEYEPIFEKAIFNKVSSANYGSILSGKQISGSGQTELQTILSKSIFEFSFFNRFFDQYNVLKSFLLTPIHFSSTYSNDENKVDSEILKSLLDDFFFSGRNGNFFKEMQFTFPIFTKRDEDLFSNKEAGKYTENNNLLKNDEENSLEYFCTQWNKLKFIYRICYFNDCAYLLEEFEKEFGVIENKTKNFASGSSARSKADILDERILYYIYYIPNLYTSTRLGATDTGVSVQNSGKYGFSRIKGYKWSMLFSEILDNSFVFEMSREHLDYESSNIFFKEYTAFERRDYVYDPSPSFRIKDDNVLNIVVKRLSEIDRKFSKNNYSFQDFLNKFRNEHLQTNNEITSLITEAQNYNVSSSHAASLFVRWNIKKYFQSGLIEVFGLEGLESMKNNFYLKNVFNKNFTHTGISEIKSDREKRMIEEDENMKIEFIKCVNEKMLFSVFFKLFFLSPVIRNINSVNFNYAFNSKSEYESIRRLAPCLKFKNIITSFNLGDFKLKHNVFLTINSKLQYLLFFTFFIISFFLIYENILIFLNFGYRYGVNNLDLFLEKSIRKNTFAFSSNKINTQILSCFYFFYFNNVSKLEEKKTIIGCNINERYFNLAYQTTCVDPSEHEGAFLDREMLTLIKADNPFSFDNMGIKESSCLTKRYLNPLNYLDEIDEIVSLLGTGNLQNLFSKSTSFINDKTLPEHSEYFLPSYTNIKHIIFSNLFFYILQTVFSLLFALFVKSIDYYINSFDAPFISSDGKRNLSFFEIVLKTTFVDEFFKLIFKTTFVAIVYGAKLDLNQTDAMIMIGYTSIFSLAVSSLFETITQLPLMI